MTPADACARASPASASSMACSQARSVVASRTRPRARTSPNSPAPSDTLETDVVLGQRRGGRARGDDVVQLRALQPGLEGVVAAEAVQHRGHPPREVLHAPDPAQAGVRVRLEAALVAALVPRAQRLAEHAHVGGGEVEALRA